MLIPSELNKNIAELESKTNLQRRASFLRPLSLGLIVMHLAATIVAVSADPFDPRSLLLLMPSLLVNIFIFYLNKYKHTRIASILFCLVFNIIVYLVFLINIISDPDYKKIGTTVAYGFLLSISVMLSGILVNTVFSIIISIINALLIVLAYTTVTVTLQDAVSPSVPIIAFIMLIALISWLYQRTLNQSFERLSVARQQLTRDAMLRQELAIARHLQSRLYPDPP
jgi:hypothetical protein